MRNASPFRHPIFARFFDRLSPLMEREVGELPALPHRRGEVIALEPEPYLRDKAEEAARDGS